MGVLCHENAACALGLFLEGAKTPQVVFLRHGYDFHFHRYIQIAQNEIHFNL